MPVPRARRLSQRYQERLHAGQQALDRLLAAIQSLLKAGNGDDPLSLAHGLDLLVGQLGADLATLVTIEGSRFETRWWSPDRGEKEAPAPIEPFCRWLADHPHRTLVLQDIPKDGRLGRHPDLQGRGVQAALGIALWHGGEARGLVFAQFRKPRRIGRADLALLGAVAGFMGRILEVEDLKATLGRMENALAITKAVMEDSSIQDPATDLPNLRYLDIWLKANLGGGRKPEPMVVALFRAPVGTRAELGRLRVAAEQIRGSDLIVAAGEDRFLVLLLGATKGLAHILLMRLRAQLEGVPVGATLWFPGQDDPALDRARRRAEEALRAAEGEVGGSVAWRLPEVLPAPSAAGEEPAISAGPRPWRPKPLRAATAAEPGARTPAPEETTIILPTRRTGRRS